MFVCPISKLVSNTTIDLTELNISWGQSSWQTITNRSICDLLKKKYTLKEIEKIKGIKFKNGNSIYIAKVIQFSQYGNYDRYSIDGFIYFSSGSARTFGFVFDGNNRYVSNAL